LNTYTFWDRLEEVHLQPQQEDIIKWKWTPDSARSGYLLMHHGVSNFPGANLLWDSWATLRVKLFLWLACRQRMWTADRRKRRGLDAHEKCLLCDQEEETANHLLVTCPMAKEIWWHVCSWARCVCTFTTVYVMEWWEHLVLAQPARRREGTSTLFMLTCWKIWKERNSRHSITRWESVQVVLGKIKAEADMWIVVGARKLGSLCCE
jgi:hypothetical protein